MAARTAGKGLSRAPAGAWLGVVGSGGDGLRGIVVGRLGWYTGAHQTFVRTTLFLCIFVKCTSLKVMIIQSYSISSAQSSDAFIQEWPLTHTETQ